MCGGGRGIQPRASDKDNQIYILGSSVQQTPEVLGVSTASRERG